ncbi:hypothetical protein H4S07_003544 [Coemansia furcata]|uniref:Uncharacterized protein n=1 Tax=Coemansia furcata TaxID=417177 RepID=A0ACC1LHG9_9FUNG|nr:hypothetical protein H4S07_003544 [Coemansia furcata]
MTVTLGYAEPLDDDFGKEHLPSKIGGKPRWLDPTCPLSVDKVLCDECASPMVMLMQLYAPEDEPAEAFHRMLYVFICRNGSCHKASARRCMRVVRSQLPEDNSIYTAQEGEAGSSCSDDEDDVSWALAEQVKPAPVCAVCGLSGGKACSKCHTRTYCSRAHQVADWDAGHRTQCGNNALPKASKSAAHTRKLQCMLYPELVIVSEEEEGASQLDIGNDDYDDDDDGSDDDGEDNEDIKPEDMALVPVTGEKVEDSEVDVDRAFLLFQRRIQKNPDQVIRYTRSSDSSEPLFVSDMGKPEAQADVPDCEVCGTAREFEFQIMPQMLNYLSIDSADPASVDWGTLLVYTCPKSCNGASGASTYAPEVVCRQNFSSQGIGEKFVRALHGDDSGITRQIESLRV